MRQRAAVVILIGGAFALGLLLGWRVQLGRGNRNERLNAATQAAAVADLCVNVLTAEEGGRQTVAARLLESRMISEIRYADAQIGDAAPPDFAMPETIEGIRRARRYAAAKGMADVAEECDRLIKFFGVRTAGSP